MSDDWYQAWIEQRRAAAPPDEMPDRVMQSVMELQTEEKPVFAVRIAGWIERSRVACCAACAAAMLIGSTPFVAYFAYFISVY
jgi:hypothetical protein